MQEQFTHELQDFQTDVIDESFKRPVVIDFWAEWCAPCRSLGPILEKLEAKAEGAWKLVKINTDENPDIAQVFGLKSIPLVKMFKDGKEVDEFVGAIPEQKIIEWLQKHVSVKKESGLDLALQAMQEGRHDEAKAMLESLLNSDMQKRARVHLAHLLLFTDTERAAVLMNEDDPEREDWELAEAVKTFVPLLQQLEKPEVFPEAPVRSLFLSAAQAARNEDFDTALTQFIEAIKEDRYYMDDYARKICIAIFKLSGEESPVTLRHRRAFGSALYI